MKKLEEVYLRQLKLWFFLLNCIFTPISYFLWVKTCTILKLDRDRNEIYTYNCPKTTLGLPLRPEVPGEPMKPWNPTHPGLPGGPGGPGGALAVGILTESPGAPLTPRKKIF